MITPGEKQRADDMAAALRKMISHFPTDDDMRRAGWEWDDIDAACTAYEGAQTALANYERHL